MQQVAQALQAERCLSPSCFSIHPYYPENFSVVFDSISSKDLVLQGGSIKTEHFLLLLHQWSKPSLASVRPMHFRVDLSLEGIPIHAWSLATVSAILSPSCCIESFDEFSTSRADLSAFRLVAWSFNPSVIPKQKTLIIAEPELLPDGSLLDHANQVFSPPIQDRAVREALVYTVIVHIHSVVDFLSETESYLPFAPSSDDSGHGGLPDSNSIGSSPRWHVFSTNSGQLDGVLPLGGGRCGGAQAGSWRLPPLSGLVRRPDRGPPFVGAWVGDRRAGHQSPPNSARPKAACLMAEKQVLNPFSLSFSPVNSGKQVSGQRPATARLLSLPPPCRHVGCQTDPSLLQDLCSEPPSHPSKSLWPLWDVSASPNLESTPMPVEPSCPLPSRLPLDYLSPASTLLAVGASLALTLSGIECSARLENLMEPQLQSLHSSPRGTQLVETALITYSRRIKCALPSPILSLPDVQQARWNVLPTNFTPRRSARLTASYSNCAPTALRTKLMLATTLGVSADSASGTVTKFHKLFNSPLSSDQIKALATRFRMSVPTAMPCDGTSIATTSAAISPVPAC